MNIDELIEVTFDARVQCDPYVDERAIAYANRKDVVTVAAALAWIHANVIPSEYGVEVGREMFSDGWNQCRSEISNRISGLLSEAEKEIEAAR